MARARAECDVVAVSIFVNPLQFGDPEDIAHYPRTLERDLLVCAEAGADVVFVPSVGEMYPSWPAAPVDDGVGARRQRRLGGRVAARATSTAWPPWWPSCSPSPGPAGPTSARRTSSSWRWSGAWRVDLSLPVEVVGCPIVREPDGLALSSRNVRLSAAERAAATVLSRALAAGRAALADGERSGAAVGRAMRAVVAAEPLVELDYAVVVDADTLEEVAAVAEPPAAVAPAHRGPGGPGPADRQLRRRGRPPTTSAPYPAATGHGAPTRKDRVSRCAAA